MQSMEKEFIENGGMIKAKLGSGVSVDPAEMIAMAK